MGRNIAVLFFAAVVSTAQAQRVRQTPSAILSGVTVDTLGAPLRGVEVSIGARRWRAITDDSGRFRLTGVDTGLHVVVARRLGLSPESLSTTMRDNEPAFLRIVFRSEAAQLERVDVSDAGAIPARLEGFEKRRARHNGGHFLTREDIDRVSPLRSSDLLRRVQGIRMVDSMGTTLAISSRGPKMQLGGRQAVQCVVRVGVDGMLKEPYFPVNTIAPIDIHGVEVYAGAATVPVEFGGARRDASCGLIMIWTRSR